MPTIRRSVSSLASLAAFEAAARHESFTRAAEELGVTQAAVSRRVKHLEDELGTSLFVRAHRKVELTAPGQALARVTSDAFGRVAETVEAIRRPAASDTVVLGMTLAFSHFWLVPRLAAFRRAHPGVRLRLVSEDAEFDLRQARMDVVVRYGAPPFPDAVILASLADEVFPVGSEALVGPTAGLPDAEAIQAVPLINLEWLDLAWLSWSRWAPLAGVTDPGSRGELRFNHYTDAVYAAVAGQGVVLGWRRLIGGFLADGRLVRLGTAAAVPVERYHVLHPAGREPSPATELFTDWLVGEIGAEA